MNLYTRRPVIVEKIVTNKAKIENMWRKRLLRTFKILVNKSSIKRFFIQFSTKNCRYNWLLENNENDYCKSFDNVVTNDLDLTVQLKKTRMYRNIQNWWDILLYKGFDEHIYPVTSTA